MKKQNLQFGSLPKIYSRRMPGASRFGSASYKTDAELDAEKVALLKKINDDVTEKLATRASKEDVKTEVTEQMKTFKEMPLEALREMAKVGEDGKPAIMKMIADQGAKILELEKRGTGKPEDLSIRGQVKQWREANKEAIEKLSKGQKAELTNLEIRVNSPMTPANTYSSGTYLPFPTLMPGVNEIVRVEPTFWDYIRKGSASSAQYVWVNKVTPLGAADFIGPGVAKPGISFQLQTQTSNAKKVAAKEKIATELLQDIEGFNTMVEQELRYQVDQATNLALMSGTVSATDPAGIQSLSVTFTQTGLATTNPNNWDAIIAAKAQLTAGNLKGKVTAFLNPVDIANMKMTKAISQGQPFISQETGVTLVEDNNIPVGYVQIAILEYYKILVWQDYTVAYGWENTDFTDNLITVIGERRIHQIFSTNFTGAFIYDTLANIKTAITAV